MQDVIIGSDHRGFELKQKIKEHLRANKYFFIDLGCSGTESADFPKIAKEVAETVTGSRHMCGILLCGTGIGMSMAANRFKGIRAALCNSAETARIARGHNDANVLCLAADGADFENVKKIVNAFITAKFSGEEKYKKRNAMLDN